MSDTNIGALIQALNTAFPASVTDDSVYDILQRGAGVRVEKAITLNGNGAQNDNLFEITGEVEVLRIYGVCTEATDATTCTAASFDVYDGTAAYPLTSAAGVALSGMGVGGAVYKDDVAANAATLDDNATGGIVDGGGAGYYTTFCPFRTWKKLGVSTYIRFNFTGDANTDIDMNFYVDYIPLDGGTLVAV